MRITAMNWMQVEEYLRSDDRVAVPLGSVEQHAYLSLATDAILAERVALDAAEPLGVPVYPALPFGCAPYFMAFPGTVTLRPETHAAVVTDVLDSLVAHGFRRILLVNGHGGNSAAADVAREWAAAADRARAGQTVRVRFHDWWKAPRTKAAVRAAASHGSHANWMESFPWTRIGGATPSTVEKPPVEIGEGLRGDPAAFRELLGDGSFGGRYGVDDATMLEIWGVAVDETRALLRDWEGDS